MRALAAAWPRPKLCKSPLHNCPGGRNIDLLDQLDDPRRGARTSTTRSSTVGRTSCCRRTPASPSGVTTAVRGRERPYDLNMSATSANDASNDLHVVHLTTDEVRLLRQHAYRSVLGNEGERNPEARYWLPIARSAYEKLRAIAPGDDPTAR